MVEFILHFLSNVFIVFASLFTIHLLDNVVLLDFFKKLDAKGEAFFIYTSFAASLLILTYLVDIKAVPFLINLILRW